MTKYVLANWKSQKTMSEAEAWLEKFCQVYRPHPQVQVIVSPPALYLVTMWQQLSRYKTGNLVLAAQDLSPFPLGTYTGEIAAEMVRDLVDYVIIGHSERRRYFHETNQDVANKISEVKAAGIKPIVCVDLPYARSQIAAFREEDIDETIIGYGPVEAIGIETAQPLAKTKGAIAEIRDIAPGSPILYGGSINVDNAVDYLRIPGLAGVMVGTASLDPEEFAVICTEAAKGQTE